MRSLAIVRDNIHLAQMDRAAQIECALLGDLAIAVGNPVQQLEHRLNSTQGRSLGGLRVMEGQEIAVPRAPQTAQPAALPDLADQRPQIANGLAANRIPAEQIADSTRSTTTMASVTTSGIAALSLDAICPTLGRGQADAMDVDLAGGFDRHHLARPRQRLLLRRHAVQGGLRDHDLARLR